MDYIVLRKPKGRNRDKLYNLVVFTHAGSRAEAKRNAMALPEFSHPDNDYGAAYAQEIRFDVLHYI